MKNKLNVLLAVTDHLGAVYKSGIGDYLNFFKSKQNAFRGEKKTYVPAPDTIDVPEERSNKLIVTTVDEKLKWFEETHTPYIDALFSQERTNATGTAKAKLKVDNIDFGEYTSLELLRLKSLLENGELEQMYANIPVRADDEEWVQTTNEDYTNRKGIFESPKVEGTKKTTQKEHYILVDPNIQHLKDAGKYTPQVSVKDTIMVLGQQSRQKFSGEWSHRERADLLRRRSKLYNAVIEALKIANDVEAVDSKMTAKLLFGYLHTGKIE